MNNANNNSTTEHMTAVAKRMASRIQKEGESVTRHYLITIGWSQSEADWIIKKAKKFLER